jgi:hypothetical protein
MTACTVLPGQPPPEYSALHRLGGAAEYFPGSEATPPAEKRAESGGVRRSSLHQGREGEFLTQKTGAGGRKG